MLKRALDVALSAILMVVALPIVGLIALAIKASSGGRVVFQQTRCGLNGRSFTLYKFRTMVEDAEEQRGALQHLNEMQGPVFKLRRDPRVTWLGKFLRKFSHFNAIVRAANIQSHNSNALWSILLLQSV